MKVIIYDFERQYACVVDMSVNEHQYIITMENGASYTFYKCLETPEYFNGKRIPLMPGHDFLYWIERDIQRTGQTLTVSVYQPRAIVN